MGNENDNQEHSSTDISADMSHISSSSTSHRRNNSPAATPFSQKQKSDDEDEDEENEEIPLKSEKSSDIKPKEIRVIYLFQQPDLSFVYFCPYCEKPIPFERDLSHSKMRNFFEKLVRQREGIDTDIHFEFVQSEEAFQHLLLQYPKRECVDHNVISDDENVEDSEESEVSSISNFFFCEDSDYQNLLDENESDVEQYSDIITPNYESNAILNDGLIEPEDDATAGNPIPVILYVSVTVTCTLILY